MDQDLFDALMAAGYAPTTAVKYASPAHPLYPRYRGQLDSGEPIAKHNRRSGDREVRIRQLLDAGYAPTTAATYASRPPEHLPGRARVALGLVSGRRGEKSQKRAETVRKLVEGGYLGSTAYKLASTPVARMPKKAQALLGHTTDQTREKDYTPEQQRALRIVRRKLKGSGARWGDFVLDFPKVRYNGIEVLGGVNFKAWRELTVLMDPDSLV